MYVYSSLLDSQEAGALLEAAKRDVLIQENAQAFMDANGLSSRISGWNHPGDVS
jgi:hypothetical protein